MNHKIKVLIIEDDPYLGMIMKECFETREFEAYLFASGKDGLDGYFKLKPDICILDVMLPMMDGFTIAKNIRSADQQTPIIFLTAKSMKEDVMEGFGVGADDYVKKPFSIEELIMRVHAILKRSSTQKTGNQVSKTKEYRIGHYVFDTERQLLISDHKNQKLTSRESELLQMLCDNPNETLDRNFALKKLWGDDSFFNARSMDVYITKLRNHFKNDPGIEIINIRGKGYKLLLMK